MAEEKKRRDPTWFDDQKTHLYAEPLREGAKPPRLRITRDENNNPVIDVDLGIETEAKYEGAKTYPIRMETPMAPIPLREMMDLIIRMADYKGVASFEITNWGRPFIWNNEQKKSMKAQEDMIISRFQIAKNEAGVVTLSVAAAKGGNSATFTFKSNRYHAITQNGQEAAVSLTSGLNAAAWAGFIKDAFNTDYIENWKEPEWQKRKRAERAQQFGGGQQGGYQNRGPQGQQQRPPQQQSYQQPQQQPPQQSYQPPAQHTAPQQSQADESFDSDLPF